MKYEVRAEPFALLPLPYVAAQAVQELGNIMRARGVHNPPGASEILFGSAAHHLLRRLAHDPLAQRMDPLVLSRGRNALERLPAVLITASLTLLENDRNALRALRNGLEQAERQTTAS